MKNRITFILTLLLLAVFAHLDAQMSDSMYNYLPANLKPAKQNAVTVKERVAILSWGKDAFTERFGKEIASYVPAVEKEMLTSKNGREKTTFAVAIAGYYQYKVDYEKSFEFYKKAALYAGNDTANRQNLVIIYPLLAAFYSLYKKPDTSMMYLEKALQIMDPKDTVVVCNVYGAYATIYDQLGLSREAIDYNKKFIEMLPVENHLHGDDIVIIVQNAILYNYIFRDEHIPSYRDSAIQMVTLARERAKKIDERVWRSSCYYVLGELAMWDGKYKEALAYFDSSLLPENIKYNHYDGVDWASAADRAICRVKLGDSKAVAALDTISIPITGLAVSKYKYKVLYEYEKEHHNWPKALKYHEAYMRISDSLNLNVNRGKVFEVNQKYSTAKKEIQIKTLENVNLSEKQSKNRIAIIAIAAVALMLVLLALLYARNRKKEVQRVKEKEKMMLELQSMEQERELRVLQQQAEKDAAVISERKAIAQNMHDEISSGLTGLSYLISHVKRNMSRNGSVPIEMLVEVEEEAKNIYRQARNFMHALNENALTESYNITDLLRQLHQRFDQQYGLRIIVDMDEESINTYFKTMHHTEMYRVIKEAVTNSIKHSGADTITIKLVKGTNDFYFDISDNGHGIRQQQPGGMGLAGMKERIEVLNGQLTVTSNNSGTHISGTFPC